MPTNQNEWKTYVRTGQIQARPYKPGEDLSNISVSAQDNPKEGDMICRNPVKPDDQWLVDKEYFSKNYKEGA